MIKTILTALTESLILESYKDVKMRFINDGADKDEVTKLLDLHKKLKNMNRLKKDEINIDVFTKGKSFDEFKSLMSRYSEKDTATKTDKWTALKNKIIGENDEWTVYAIDTPEEAYLFHGLVKWCISSGSKEDAARYFNNYSINETSVFFAIVRKNPIGDEYDYIMDQYNWNDDKHTYWDSEDNDQESLEKDLNVPTYENTISNIVKKAKSDAKNKVLSMLELNDDGTYSYDGPLERPALMQVIDNGKFIIKFKEVGGSFNCDQCGLTSLEGAPQKVGWRFYCGNNKLTSLKGAPEEVVASFDCSRNKLTSLKGAPQKVGFNFYCFHNKLTSLGGAPKEVGGDFDCSNNNLTSIESAPKTVGGGFYCGNNKLTSLEGGPKKVGASFKCLDNNLTSLEGAPEEVGWSFDCSHNNLTSLEGAPKEIGGDFNCSFNKDLKSLDGAPSKIGVKRDGYLNIKKTAIVQHMGEPTKESLKGKIEIKGKIII